MSFYVGDIVRTVKGSAEQGEGLVMKIIKPTTDMQLLWGSKELHYLIKDNQTGEYISVIERGIEKA